VLLSHKVELPRELESFSARFDLPLPTAEERKKIVKRVAVDYAAENPGLRVQVDPKAYGLLIQNLAGLPVRDTEQLARNAIYHDGAISKSDLPKVMEAKYELLNRGGILQFEYDTAKFNNVGGLEKLKHWLSQRKPAFMNKADAAHLDTPKGILLIGVQGCGKSLAARATAGIFGLPLLRLDFGNLYDKYHGETERNLRESLKTADVMSPCVLWIDEIEKGLAGRGGETERHSECWEVSLHGWLKRTARCLSSQPQMTSAHCLRNSSARADLTRYSLWTCPTWAFGKSLRKST
jgi:hypothetical protein